MVVSLSFEAFVISNQGFAAGFRGDNLDNQEFAPARGSAAVRQRFERLVVPYLPEAYALARALTGNRADNNDDLGIEAVPGVRGSGNTATGNHNPLQQCVGIVCG